LCLAIGVQHPDYLRLNRRQHDDWLWLWSKEPWGDRRQDYRSAAYLMRWSAMLSGSEEKPPSLLWPHFEKDVDPEEMIQRGKSSDDALEPKPGGGYRWKPGRGPKLDGNDNR
jgi:hypothetical protein